MISDLLLSKEYHGGGVKGELKDRTVGRRLEAGRALKGHCKAPELCSPTQWLLATLAISVN